MYTPPPAPPVFVLPSAVLTRLQINADLDGVSEVMLSAIVGAQLHVQAILDSRLEYAEHTARYFLDSDAFSAIQPHGQFRLELPTGFVRLDQPFTLLHGSDWRMCDSRLIPPSDYILDPVRGRLLLDARPYRDAHIGVKFTAGFTPGDPEDIENNPPEEIPDWLQESIISYVGVVLDVSQTTNRNPDAAAAYARAGDHAMAILSPYTRRQGFTFRPA